MARARVVSVGLLCLLLLPAAASARKKKNPNEFPPVIVKSKEKEEKDITQTLPELKAPPHIVIGDSSRLAFLVTPLSAKGLLSQQTRDGFRWMLQNAHGGTVLKVRAFVAGTGDVRRVQEILSEVFTERKLNLPVLTVAQVGALPLEGAQILMEAIVADKRQVTEHGIAFISAQRGTKDDPIGPLQAAVQGTNLEGTDVRRVTCYLSALEDYDRTRQQVAQVFPNAGVAYVQVLRGSTERFVACEAAAALRRPPAKPLMFIGAEPGRFALAAIIAPQRIALTGIQLAFHNEDADLRLAFDRLGKTLESAGTSYKQVLMMHVYTMYKATGERVNHLRAEYHGPSVTPAGTLLMFEGLPGLEASFAMDVIAAL
jgi:enamine deaminase RidA (YjgF/YER057c/UK114 family)